MTPFKIQNNYSFTDPGRSTRAVEVSGQRLGASRPNQSAGAEAKEWVKVTKSQVAFRSPQSVNSTLNLVARSIRKANSAMEKIGTLIGEMRAQLESVVKNYPPFPSGSEERVRYLESYTGLRMQIDQLTIPPDDDGARRIMADAAAHQEAGDWDVRVGAEGDVKTIRSRQVHSGPTGLDIPALGKDAGDQEIYAALQKLDSAYDRLNAQREGLAGDATNIKRSREFTGEDVRMYPSYGEDLKTAKDEETSAVFRSASVKQALSMHTMNGLTGAQSDFLELL